MSPFAHYCAVFENTVAFTAENLVIVVLLKLKDLLFHQHKF